jgi:RNA polymerase sigma-70 factor (ECF subfamily)
VIALPEKYRTVLHLFYYEDLSTKEIAGLLELRQSAVTTRLHRARELLKKQLGENWVDE